MKPVKPDAFDWMVEHFIQDGIIVPHDPTGKRWCIERQKFAQILRLQHATRVRLVKRLAKQSKLGTVAGDPYITRSAILEALVKLKEATR